MELKEIMKLRREVLRLSQFDLAEMAGGSLATVKDIESSKGNPSLATMGKILDVLGLVLPLWKGSRPTVPKVSRVCGTERG